MDAVGYDMYCKILGESVKEARGLSVDDEEPITVDLQVDAFIPDKYIPSTNIRIDTYKRIAAIENEDDASEITDEMLDRFGDMPRSAANLLEIARIKALAAACGIRSITQKGNEVVFEFSTESFLPELVRFIVENYSKTMIIGAGETPSVKYRFGESKKLLSNIKFVLQQINELHSGEK